MSKFGMFQNTSINAGVNVALTLENQCNFNFNRLKGENIISSFQYMQKKAFAKIQYPFII